MCIVISLEVNKNYIMNDIKRTLLSSGLSRLELFTAGRVGSKFAPQLIKSSSSVAFPGVTAKTVDEIRFPQI